MKTCSNHTPTRAPVTHSRFDSATQPDDAYILSKAQRQVVDPTRCYGFNDSGRISPEKALALVLILDDVLAEWTFRPQTWQQPKMPSIRERSEKVEALASDHRNSDLNTALGNFDW